MRRLLAVAILIGLAEPVQAAQLALRFVHAEYAFDRNTAVLLPGESILVEVTWTVSAGEAAAYQMAGIGIQPTSVPESPFSGTQGEMVADPDLLMSNNSTSLPGWEILDRPGPVGGSGVFGAAATELEDGIATAGTTVIGTFNITLSSSATLGVHSFYVHRSRFPEGSPLLYDSAGPSLYTFDPDGDGYNRRYNIGAGFAGYDDGTGAIPLYVVTPEPTMLWLLVCGALAIVGGDRPRQRRISQPSYPTPHAIRLHKFGCASSSPAHTNGAQRLVKLAG